MPFFVHDGPRRTTTSLYQNTALFPMWWKVSSGFILPFRYSSLVLIYTCCWQRVSCLNPVSAANLDLAPKLPRRIWDNYLTRPEYPDTWRATYQIQECPFCSSTLLGGASESTKQPSALRFGYCHDAISLDWSSTEYLPGSSYIVQNNNKKTTLYELLERSQNLPTELIAIIWDFIAPCTIRCLLSLSATENTWPDCSSGARSGTISLHGNIAVYRTCVLGGTYICGIRQGNNIYGHESSVSLNVPVPSFATAFVFRIGIYGLRSIDFVTDTKTNPFSKGDITVKDNEFISIIHHQHEVDLDWDVWCPQPLSDECSKLMQSNTEPENRTHQLPRQTAFWTWLSMDKSITTGSPIPSLCRLILSLAAPLWFCQTFPEIHGIYSTAGGWIQAVWSHCILLWKGTCWPGYSFLLLTILLAQVILVWWAKGLLCSCPIWRFRGCEPTYSLLAPEWPSGKDLSHCMFNTAYPEITEL